MYELKDVFQDVQTEFIVEFSAAALEVGITIYNSDGTVKVARSLASTTDLGNKQYSIKKTFYTNSFAADWQGILEFDAEEAEYSYQIILIKKNPETTESILVDYKISEDQIRTFMQDKPELNLFLQRIEFEPKELQAAVDMIVSKFNCLPPQGLKTTAKTFPEVYLLLIGVTSYLLKSKINNFIRNKLSYQGGNFPLAELESKFPEYMQIASNYDQEFETLARPLKIGMNAEKCMGSLSSPLARYNDWGV
mgnify:CR=1 FL=1